MARPFIAFLTDFGTRDHYAGAMKGVALGICPDAVLVDVTHDVPAHDVAAGALLISEAGGTITALDGQPFSLERPTFIAAGSVGLHATLFELIGDRRG